MDAEVSGIGKGWTVYDVDGSKVGEVDEAFPTYLKLRRGFLVKHDLFVPVAAVSRLRGDEVHLTVRENDLEALGWDTPPADAPRPWTTLRRMPPDEALGALADGAFTRTTWRIPVRGERVAVTKTPVISSELVITKERGVQQVHLDTTTRRVEVAVETPKPTGEPIEHVSWDRERTNP